MELSQKIKEANEVLQHLSLIAVDYASKAYATYLVRTGPEGQSGHDGEVITNRVELGDEAKLADFISEARSVWDRKLAALLESNHIGEDAVPYFDTDHLSSITKLGCNTYSNKAGLVKLSEEGIKHVVDMLKSISDNVDGVTHIAIVVPTLEMFEDTSTTMRSHKVTMAMSKLIESCKVRCSITFNPYLKDKKNWYVFDTSKEYYGPRIVIQEPLSFTSLMQYIENGIFINENEAKISIMYSTMGYVHLGPARNVIRATHF